MAFTLLDRKLALSMFIILWGYCSISGAMSRPIDPSDKAFFIQKHAEWMAEHNIIYLNSVEHNKRLDIFTKNYLAVEKHNKEGNKSFKLSLNKFADMSDDEFNTHHLGARISNSTPKATTASFMHGKLNYDELPASLDWRDRGAVTNVKDQAGCRGCWSFAATGAVESVVQIKTGNLYSLSEQQLLDCVPHTEDPCFVEGRGEWAFDYIKQNGIVSENDYGYQARANNCDQDKVKSRRLTQISGYEYVPSCNEIELLKAVNMQPVMAAVDASGCAFKFYKEGILTPDSCNSCGGLNHVVLLVGYGMEEDGTKYWLAKNSWGTGWGDNGYIKLSRDCGYQEGCCGLATSPLYPVYNVY